LKRDIKGKKEMNTLGERGEITFPVG